MSYDFRKLKEDVLQRYARASELARKYPRLSVVAPVFTGLFLVFLIRMLAYGRVFPQQAMWLLPLPLMLYLFLRKTDHSVSGLYTEFSPPAANIAASGFFLALFTPLYIYTICLITGIAGAMFIFMDYHAFRRLLAQNRSAAVAATMGALSGILFFFAQKGLWKILASASANIVYFLLHVVIPKMAVFPKGQRPDFLRIKAGAPPVHHQVHRATRRVHVRVDPNNPPAPKPAALPPKPKMQPGNNTADFMAVASEHFTLKIAIIQNITIGIFLFLFLLSLELTLSGRKLKPLRFAVVALGGIAIILLINALALTGYFFINDMALTQGANDLIVQTAKGLRYLFSSQLVCLVSYVAVCILAIRVFFKSPAILNIPKPSFR